MLCYKYSLTQFTAPSPPWFQIESGADAKLTFFCKPHQPALPLIVSDTQSPPPCLFQLILVCLDAIVFT